MDKFSNHLAKKKWVEWVQWFIITKREYIPWKKKIWGPGFSQWIECGLRFCFILAAHESQKKTLPFLTLIGISWTILTECWGFFFSWPFLFYINSSVTLQNLLKNNYIQLPIIFMFNLTLSFIKANFPSKITYGFLTFIFQFT